MTYADVMRPGRSALAVWYDVVLVLLGVTFIAVCAQIRLYLPQNPVPVTGQTFAVLFVGTLYGAKRGGLTTLSYVSLGSLGVPVFASSSLGGPTSGYLVGFIFASYIVGDLAERGWDKSPLTTAFAMLLGNLVIYGFGIA